MDLTSLCKPKEEVITLTPSVSLSEALDIMEDQGFRCLPVLDDAKIMFRGNIYKQHIYQYYYEHHHLNTNVLELLRNTTKHVMRQTSYYGLFFAIHDLPYIAVLNEDRSFYSILTYHNFERFSLRAWRLEDSNYILRVTVSHDAVGPIMSISKIINKYAKINNLSTLNQPESPLYTDLIFALKIDSFLHLQQLIDRLKRKGYGDIATTALTKAFLSK